MVKVIDTEEFLIEDINDEINEDDGLYIERDTEFLEDIIHISPESNVILGVDSMIWWNNNPNDWNPIIKYDEIRHISKYEASKNPLEYNPDEEHLIILLIICTILLAIFLFIIIGV